MAKFEIGQAVEVSFMGEIKSIEKSGDQIVYTVRDYQSKAYVSATVTESQVHALPVPEDFKVTNG